MFLQVKREKNKNVVYCPVADPELEDLNILVKLEIVDTISMDPLLALLTN